MKQTFVGQAVFAVKPAIVGKAVFLQPCLQVGGLVVVEQVEREMEVQWVVSEVV